MTDIVTYCDINTCEDCPRYADDCDGDKRVEHTDLISRADAIEAVHKYFVEAFNNEPHEIDEDGYDVLTDMKSVNALLHHNKYVSKALKALPSADAVHIETYRELYEKYVELKHASADAVQGEWIDVKNEPYCECSVCGSYIDNLDDDYAFCPRCGARMIGGDTE